MSSMCSRKIFQSAVKSVQPEQLIAKNLFRNGNVLQFGDQEHILNHNVYIVGFGKAVYGMCKAVQNMVAEHLVNGALSVPHGLVKSDSSSGRIQQFGSPDYGKVTFHEGARHNQPDEESLLAAAEIRKICEKAEQGSLVIALISGGGSALLPSPVPPLTLKEKSEAISKLAAEGADIQQLNVVRQHLSMLKGGQLAQLAFPAKVWGFILSDIIGDPTELIASGPTVPCTSKPSDALRILQKYHIRSSVSPNVISILEKLSKKETKPDRSENISHVYNKIVGNNTIALNSAQQEAERLGYKPLILSHKLNGEAKFLGVFFAELSIFLSKCGEGRNESMVASLIEHGMLEPEINSFFNDLSAALEENVKLCVLSGGETTVTLSPKHGLGGRNQETVLSFVAKLHELTESSNNNNNNHHHFKNRSLTFLSAGTDGQDGPTSVAGAVFSYDQLGTFDSPTAEKYLNDHDSNSYFSNIANDNLVVTGLTGTNVMDIQVLVFESRS